MNIGRLINLKEDGKEGEEEKKERKKEKKEKKKKKKKKKEIRKKETCPAISKSSKIANKFIKAR